MYTKIPAYDKPTIKQANIFVQVLRFEKNRLHEVHGVQTSQFAPQH